MRTINLSGRQVLPDGTFLMYPEHSYLLREESRRLSDSYERWLNIRMTLIIIYSFALLICIFGIKNWAPLALRGQETDAVVTDRFSIYMPTEPGLIVKYTDKVYYVVYEYDVFFRGRMLHMKQQTQVPVEIHDRIVKGTRMKVRYLPEAPDYDDLQWKDHTPYIMLLCLAFAMLSVTFLTTKLVNQIHSLWRLKREGWVLSGRMLASSMKSTMFGLSLSVAYEFTTPDHQTLRGEETAVRSDLGGTPPAPGTPVGVIYVSPQCYRLL